MFRRLLFDDWVMIFPLVAFITATSIYATLTWRALRMRRSQVEHFARLPFENETTVSLHEAE